MERTKQEITITDVFIDSVRYYITVHWGEGYL